MGDETSLRLTKAPLTEALIGIQLPLNPGFSGFLLGSFWSKISHFFTKPSLRGLQGGSPGIKLVSTKNDFALQVLDTGFYFSWFHSPNGEDYPRFESFLKLFVGFFLQYTEFLREHKFPIPPITGLNMGYTNLIPRPPDLQLPPSHHCFS